MKQFYFSLFLVVTTVLSYAQVSYSPLYNNTTFNNRNITLKPVGSTSGAAGVIVSEGSFLTTVD